MSASQAYQLTASLDTPRGVDVPVFEADQNIGRVQGRCCVAAHNPFERERVRMDHGLSHPVVGRGKSIRIKQSLVAKSARWQFILERVSNLGQIRKRVPARIEQD